MRFRRKWRLALVVLILALTDGTIHAATLNKCCDTKQTLQGKDGLCKPYIEEEDWLPIIFASAPQGGFVTAELDNLTILTATRPVCKNGKPPIFIHSPKEYPAFALLDMDPLSLLMLHSENDYPPIFGPESFCVDWHSALVCDATPPQVGIRKCCGSNAAYSFDTSSCIHGEEYNSEELSKFGKAYGFPACDSGLSTYIIAGEIEGNLTDVVDKENGSLQLAPPPSPSLGIDEYCLERVIEKSPRVVSVLVCAPPMDPKIQPAWPDHTLDLRFTLYPAALAISAFFLAATLATGCLLPKAHHVLHWRCQTLHVACLLIGDVILAIVQLAGPALPPAACRSMAVMMHFFFLSAFFWLNAMCFNIWWTFRDIRPSTDPAQERFRYRAYSVYAWGGPLMISGIALLLDMLEGDFSSGLLRPRFGERRCWFYGDWEIFAFFYGPVGVLLLINLTLYSVTTHALTCGLWRQERVKSVNGGGSTTHIGTSASERLTLRTVCLKLVVVMGVTWIVDVISWAVGGPAYVWFVTDLVNALQGVFIFIVVGCQPQVWAAVKRLWWCSRGSGPQQGSTAANPMSCTSQGVPSTTAAEATSSPVATVAQPTPAPIEPPLETPC